jgi:hypothetical protein
MILELILRVLIKMEKHLLNASLKILQMKKKELLLLLMVPNTLSKTKKQ